MRQAALLFDEGVEASRSPQVRGGKGANLAEMATLGLPVPPGFTLPTGISRAYMENGCLPRRVDFHLRRGIAELEERTGRRFGDPANPLLVSVRSGAAVSMPGMMDTILNVGFTLDTRAALAARFGERFASETYRRFVRQLGAVIGFDSRLFDGIDTEYRSEQRRHHEYNQLADLAFNQPVYDLPWEQLIISITGVFDSWNSERAIAYRESQGLPHWMGTAVTVQAMVYGNMDDDSCTGVVFSHDVNTGVKGLYGEYLVCAQGEEIVSGTRTPRPIADMVGWNANHVSELDRHVTTLAQHMDCMVDVEFTVESGRLYILQARKANRAPLAGATYAVHQVWAKRWSHEEAIASVSDEEVDQLTAVAFDQSITEAMLAQRTVARGLPASSGIGVGVVARSSEEALQMHQNGRNVILVTHDTLPEDLPGMLVSKAIVTAVGGVTCHAAVVARGLGVPAVVGCGDLKVLLDHFDAVTVDGQRGIVVWGEFPLAAAERTKEVNIFLGWRRRFCYKPRIGFEWREQEVCVNQVLADFYLTSHMAKESHGSKYQAEASSLWERILRDTSEMLAAYLVIAVGGELRYYWFDHKGKGSEQTLEAVKSLQCEFGYLPSRDRGDTQKDAFEILKSKSLDQQIRFAQAAYQIFNDAFWGYSAWGGKRWAQIAKALLDFLEGAVPSSVFVDHTLDLRHNGGRLFNKHSMVSARTEEGLLQRQLDVKKRVSGVSNLRTSMLEVVDRHNWIRYSSSNLFSLEVHALWTKGHEDGLW